MSSKEAQEIRKAHIQRYVRAVFADRLREEGFVSYNGEDLSWYRVVNKEIIQTVYFYTRRTFTPIFLNLGYGIHPLFTPPVIPMKAFVYDLSWEREIVTELDATTIEGMPTAPYDAQTDVFCPRDGKRGLEIFTDQVLPIFLQADSLATCYEFHKSYYKHWNAIERVSIDFIDQAIYMGDEELCAIYREILPKGIESYKEWEFNERATIRAKKFAKKAVEQLQARQNALTDGGREEYLAELEKRKQRVIRTLDKKLGIQV